MKKFIGFLVLVALVVVGATYYLSTKVEKEYNENLKVFDSNITKIVSSEFQRGILASNATTIISISKSIFGNQPEVEELKDDLMIKVVTNLSHSPLDFISGSKSSGFIEIQNEPYKEIVKKYTNTDKIIKFDLVAKLDKYRTDLETAPLNIQKEDVKFKMTPLKFHTVSDKNGNIYSIKLAQDSARMDAISSGITTNISYDGFDYLIEFLKPINAASIKDFTAFLNEKINFALTNFTIKNPVYGNIVAENITSKSDIKDLNDTISSLDKTDIAKLTIETMQDSLGDTASKPVVKKGELLLNQISLDSKLTNLSKPDYLNLLKRQMGNENSDTHMFDMLDDLFAILNKGPMLDIKNLSMKNDDNKTLSLNFVLGVDPKLQTPSNTYDNIIHKIVFKGEFKSDVTPKEFFSKLNDKDIDEMSNMLINEKVLQKTDSGYISKFNYIPEKGIIANGTVNLFDIGGGEHTTTDETEGLNSNSTRQ